ncbi:MAG: hypothetical protein J0H92_07665 [Sphingobacteriales bacterium]|jgi:hypothetical protein|nr:hypothetical protein [Chitinophagaceae bacterium]MBN8863231.1 hypothetical protein [Sphingobacteriales bacterium]NCT76010.1 hypothetical protein [Chitinophagaceae bacterium]OJW30126.1 MAG: hypothetical protein BGO54_00580 [Sphingobacteriales bacterium 46-32]
MKSDVMPSIIQMEADELKSLLTEVKETVATVVMPEAKKASFGTVDMWNIRKGAKSASNMLKR